MLPSVLADGESFFKSNCSFWTETVSKGLNDDWWLFATEKVGGTGIMLSIYLRQCVSDRNKPLTDLGGISPVTLTYIPTSWDQQCCLSVMWPGLMSVYPLNFEWTTLTSLENLRLVTVLAPRRDAARVLRSILSLSCINIKLAAVVH